MLRFLEQKELQHGVSLVADEETSGSIILLYKNKYDKKDSNIPVTNRDVDAFIQRNPKFIGWKKFFTGKNFKLIQQ